MSLKGTCHIVTDEERRMSIPDKLTKYYEEGMISRERYEELLEKYSEDVPKKKNYKPLFWCIAIIIVILCIILAFNVFGHQGKTDSEGGHWNSNTGTYHYHCDGHPAHSHPNGVCPYKPTSNKSDPEAVKKLRQQVLYEEYGVTGKYANKNNTPNSSEEYDKGYSAGHTKGHIEGYKLGYDDGYDKGIKDAIKVAALIFIPIVFILLIVGLVKFIKKRKQN